MTHDLALLPPTFTCAVAYRATSGPTMISRNTLEALFLPNLGRATRAPLGGESGPLPTSNAPPRNRGKSTAAQAASRPLHSSITPCMPGIQLRGGTASMETTNRPEVPRDRCDRLCQVRATKPEVPRTRVHNTSGGGGTQHATKKRAARGVGARHTTPRNATQPKGQAKELDAWVARHVLGPRHDQGASIRFSFCNYCVIARLPAPPHVARRCPKRRLCGARALELRSPHYQLTFTFTPLFTLTYPPSFGVSTDPLPRRFPQRPVRSIWTESQRPWAKPSATGQDFDKECDDDGLKADVGRA